MRRMIACVGLALVAGAMPASAQVTVGAYTWYQWSGNNHWYALTEGYVNFWDADGEAAAQGGYSASLHSAGETTFLTSTFGGGELFWIGFFQPAGSPEPGGGWTWTSGEATTYTSWNGGEPNNLGGENAAIFNWGGPGLWNDAPDNCCGYRGIMEVEALPGSTVPEPITMTLMGTGLAGVAAARRRRRQN